MAFPETHGPYFFLSITKKGGSEIQLAPMVDLTTLEIPEGDFPGEGLPNGAGGRVWKDSPQEDGEVTFEIWARELDATSAEGLFQQFHGSSETAEPLTTGTAITASVARTRDTFMLVVLWTNDPVAATAAGTTASATDSLRFVGKECRMISHKPTTSDGVLKIPVTFKYPATNRAGSEKNAFWRSGDQTALIADTYP